MIAIAGPDLPHALLRAAGCHGGPLPFDADRHCERAGRWVEDKFFPWAFPVVEHWLDGDYDCFDAVLFSRADDTSQRLYYYVCELQRRGLAKGPEPLMLDVAKIPRASSVLRTGEKLRELAVRLGVDEAALAAEMARGNGARSSANAQSSGPLCLVTGSPAPDQRLADAVRATGFAAVAETLEDSWMAGNEVFAGDLADPFAALAQRLSTQDAGSRSFTDPADRLRAKIERHRPSAVVVWRIEEDEAQCWHLPAERVVLAESGIPHLILTRRDWLARDGAADEITGFLREVGA